MVYVSEKSKFGTLLLLGFLVSGCAASKDVPPDEVPIILCHNERRTLTLPEDEALKHIDHGDKIGACSGK